MPGSADAQLLSVLRDGWRGYALGVREVKLTGMVRPDREMLTYKADFSKAIQTRRLTMKGALKKVGNNASQIARRMKDTRNRGQSLPFSETDHAEIRHLAGMVLDFANEVALMANGRRSTLELKISDELKNIAKRSV